MSDNPSRVVRSKTIARKHYSSLSGWYDIIAGGSEDIFRIKGLDLLDPKPGESVFEIGFGTGKSILDIANEVGDQGFSLGIDLADGMAEITQQRLKQSCFVNRVSLCIGDGAYLPLAAGIFDAIFISFTLELFDNPDIPRVLSQCKRILKENGRIVIVALKMNDQVKIAERVYEWFHTRMPVLIDVFEFAAVSQLNEIRIIFKTWECHPITHQSL